MSAAQKSLAGTVMVCSTVLATGVATATPPYGVAMADALARGPATGSATVTVTPGSGAFLGSYALEPGSGAGWRTQPGISMLAVTAGTLRVVQATGCAVREYTAPEVAVLPAGTIQVGNPGTAPAKFVGYFDNLPKGARPLADDTEVVRAPKGCAAGGAYRAASTAFSATQIADGTFTTNNAPAAHHYVDVADKLVVPQGGDVLMIRVTALPGTSRGWSRHAPALAIVTKGRFGTYAPTDTGCAKVEEVRAGDVVSHAHYGDHLTVVEGTEPAELIGIYWGMGNNRVPMPGLVDFVEANDFTPGLPPGCTKF